MRLLRKALALLVIGAFLAAGGQWPRVGRFYPLGTHAEVRGNPDGTFTAVFYALPHRDVVSLIERAHAASSTTFPDADPETTTFDGSGYNNSSSVDYAAVHDAANFVVKTDTATSLEISHSKPAGDNYIIHRALTLFDTSAIGAGSTISAATYSLWFTATTNEDAGSVRIVTSAPASNTAISSADYSSLGTTGQAPDQTISGITTGAYTNFTLNATGLGNVSKTGITKFGVRIAKDATNTAPTANTTTDVQASSADAGGTSQDPKLVVTYSTGGGTVAPIQIMILWHPAKPEALAIA